MGRAYLAAALLVSLSAAATAKEHHSNKLDRLVLAITSDGHCDLHVEEAKAAEYFASLHLPAPIDKMDAYGNIALFVSLGQMAERLEWDSENQIKEHCSDVVRWFGPQGTEMPEMVTGIGNPSSPG